ncbi:MAG: DUF4962 domain-containing protein [Treponema sp.]|nr:DUF4962 domain-containing protein [Treponema sp.]
MKKKTRSKFSDRFLLFSCFLICALSLGYFFTDLYRSAVRNEKPIATVYLKRKITQRKFSDSVVWDRLQNGSSLYNEDIIRTDFDSTAIIRFGEGTEKQGPDIELDENTMIQIFEPENGSFKMSVSGGNFSVDNSNSKSGVKIDLGNSSVINLSSGSKMSASFSEGKNSFVISEGEGNISTGDGKVEYIKNGEAVKIDASGNRIIYPVSVSNLDMNKKLLAFDDSEKTVDFNISKNTVFENEDIILETATDKDFKNVVLKKNVGKEDVVKVKAAEGDLYYRVYPEERSSESYEGKVSIKTIKSPSLITPAHESSYSYIHDESDDNLDIEFRWNVDEYCDYCRFEVFAANDSDNAIITKDIKERYVVIDTLKAGEYRWKITPHYAVDSIGFGKGTGFNSFTVSKTELKSIPELLLPLKNSIISLTEKDEDILFAWNSDLKNSEYQVRISKDKNFSSDYVVFKEQSYVLQKSIPFSINTLSPGTYYWYVTAIDHNNKEFKSEVNSFEVELFDPNKPKVAMIEEPAVKDAEIKAEEVKPKESAPAVQPQPVSKKNVLKKPEPKKTVPKQVSKPVPKPEPKPVVKPVVLLTPADSSKIDGLKAVREPTSFTWNSNENIKTSQFVLTKINENGTTTDVKKIDNPKGKVTLKRILPGLYRWTVKAVSSDGTDISSEVSFTFEVEPIEMLSPIKALSPEDSFVIDAEYLKNNRKILFTWEECPDATDYLFVLYKKNENGTLDKIGKKKLNKTLYWLSDLSILDVGEFEWHVTAYVHAKDGFTERRSETCVTDFSINFDLPDEIKTKEPGKMYGE